MTSAILETPLLTSRVQSWPRLGTLYVCGLPLLAGFSAMRGDNLAVAGFNYTGLLWMSTLAVGCLLWLIQKGMNPECRSYFPIAPWMIWLTVIGASLTWADGPGIPEIRDAAQQGMPVLTGILAGLFVRTPGRLKQLVNGFYYSVPILWGFSLLWFFTDLDQDIRTDVFVEKRWLAMTAVLISGLYLTGTKTQPLRGWIGWLSCLGVTGVTGSRTASLIILILPIINPLDRNLLRKAAVLSVMSLAALGVFLTPIFQERFFQGDSAGGVDKIAKGEFDSAGRFDAWPQILEKAWERPYFGHGVGTVQHYVPEVWNNVAAPHNDFLRIGYEEGLFGLAVFLSLVLWQFWNLGRLVRTTEGVVQQVAGAAWLGLASFLMLATTDNPITTTLCYMCPLLILIGGASSVASSGEVDSNVFNQVIQTEK